MRTLLLAVLVALPHAATAQAAKVRLPIIGHPGPLSIDSLAAVTTLDAPVGQTYAAVSQLFAEYKVAVDVRDSVRGIVGTTSMARMRTFAGGRLSRILNCGSGMTGENADNWRVYLTIFALLEPADAGRTTLRIALVGGARDVAGNSTDPVACGTTGRFESQVFEQVKQRLAQPAP